MNQSNENLVSRQACSIGEFSRAVCESNRRQYFRQSEAVAFGVLPERQTDIQQLARDIREAVWS